MTLAYTLSERHTLDELVAMSNVLEANKRPQPGSIYLFDKGQRRKKEAIAQAIAWKLKELKSGNPKEKAE